MSLIAFAGAIDDVYGSLWLMCITFNVNVFLLLIFRNFLVPLLGLSVVVHYICQR